MFIIRSPFFENGMIKVFSILKFFDKKKNLRINATAQEELNNMFFLKSDTISSRNGLFSPTSQITIINDFFSRTDKSSSFFLH